MFSKVITKRTIKIITGYKIRGEVFEVGKDVDIEFFKNDVLKKIRAKFNGVNENKIYLSYKGEINTIPWFVVVDEQDLYSIKNIT